MKFELRDDISKKDLLMFLGLLAGMTAWIWVIFYSGLILK